MTKDLPAPPPQFRWISELRLFAGLALAVIGFQSLIARQFYIPSESMMPTLMTGDRIVASKWPYGWSYTSLNFQLLPFVHGRLFASLPERGDVVIVTPPDPARRGDYLIKRVIGLPGDSVEMTDGRLWINGKPVASQDLGYRLIPVDGNFDCDSNRPDLAPERVVRSDGRIFCRLRIVRETLGAGRSYDTIDFGRGAHDDFPLYQVPAGHVFLMGDNRDNSADSRVAAASNGLGGAVPFENIGGRAEFISFSLNGDATWNPITWLGAFRSGRAAASLRPED